MKVFEQKFNLSEFNRLRLDNGQVREFEVPFSVQEKILSWILFLQPIRYRLNHPISILSAYRPEWHEKEMGRDGSSQHVFKGDGAIDLRAGIPENRILHDHMQFTLAKLILDSTVGRVIYYPQLPPLFSFFHIDNKVRDKETILMISDNNGLRRVDLQTFITIVFNGTV